MREAETRLMPASRELIASALAQNQVPSGPMPSPEHGPVADALAAGARAGAPLRMLHGGILLRNPFPSENEFFRRTPGVTGMATEDDAVIINPDAQLSEDQIRAVEMNEAARAFMRKHGPRPIFEPTAEQAEKLSGYGTSQDIRETIAARLFSRDPSAGASTPEQDSFISELARAMQRMRDEALQF